MEVRRTGYKFAEFDKVLQIEWTLGNTCNYNCSYCLPVLHDNSFPWIDLDNSIKFIVRLLQCQLTEIDYMNIIMTWV